MHDTRETHIKQWIEGCKQAGQTMEQLRAAELPLVSTSQSRQTLADAYEPCRLHFSPSGYSGLNE